MKFLSYIHYFTYGASIFFYYYLQIVFLLKLVTFIQIYQFDDYI